jgi:hypothetical protein
MKNPKEIEEIRSKLNMSEIADLTWLKTELNNFKEEDDVSFVGVTRIENILNTFNNFRANYTQRVLRLMRQGNILD